MTAENQKDHRRNALTSIRNTYTLAATHEEVDGEVNEIAVKHFLQTLAEVALAIAARKAGQETGR